MTTMTTMTMMQRAVAALSAISLLDGTYAYYDDAMARWYVIDEAAVATVPQYQDDPDEDIARDWYSHWCAGTTAREMPRGWSPCMAAGEYMIEYVYGGDCCEDCCAAVERLAPDLSIVSEGLRDAIDDAVGHCEYHCTSTQSHRWVDRRGNRV